MAIHDAARRASTSVSSGPTYAPMALNRPAVAARSALKVAVLNAAGGADFHAILGCLTRPPLADAGTLLLCEASWRMPKHRWVEFAPGLAAALKMSFAFVPAFGRVAKDGGLRAIGNAILCAQPLDAAWPARISITKSDMRMAGRFALTRSAGLRARRCARKPS